MPATKYVAGFSYTNQELLDLYRECLAAISVRGQSYQMNIGGGTRMFTEASLREVRATIADLEQKVDAETAAAAGLGGAQNLVRFRRPS